MFGQNSTWLQWRVAWHVEINVSFMISCWDFRRTVQCKFAHYDFLKKYFFLVLTFRIVLSSWRKLNCEIKIWRKFRKQHCIFYKVKIDNKSIISLLIDHNLRKHEFHWYVHPTCLIVSLDTVHVQRKRKQNVCDR